MNSSLHAASRSRHRSVLRLATVVGFLALCWAMPSARADNIDQGLWLQASQNVMKDLKAHSYKNVGVLKFQVQKGNAKPSLYVGRLNSLMATRLENVLILQNDEDNPLGITRGASETAAKADLEANFRTAEGRRKLFDHTYPLAWGNKSVKVDAFLTGVVKVDPVARTTTVTIRAFDKGNPEPRDVAHFSVKMDRAVLADMNQRFMASRSLKPNAEPDDEETTKAAIADAFDPNTAQQQAAALNDLLEFQIYYGETPVTPSADNKVPTPKDNQKVTFRVKAKQQLGLVLRVNGRNTLAYVKTLDDPEAVKRSTLPRDPERGPMWVLAKDREYWIEGFYVMDAKGRTKIQEFSVVPLTAVDRAALGDEGKLGQIDLDLFIQAKDVASQKQTTTYRSVVMGRTFQEVQGKVRAAAEATSKKGVIVPAPQKETKSINRVPFTGRCVARLTISYLDKGSKAPGGSK